MVKSTKKQIIRINNERLNQYIYSNHKNKSFVKINNKFIMIKFSIEGRFWIIEN